MFACIAFISIKKDVGLYNYLGEFVQKRFVLYSEFLFLRDKFALKGLVVTNQILGPY